MNATDLQRILYNHTMATSGAETRTYLGMSGIGHCPLKLYRQMVQGRLWNTQSHLYCHLGYLFEDSVKQRLAAIDPGKLGPGREFTDFGGRFQGHSDGSWDHDLLEIKSVVNERLPDDGRLPQAHYWQVQCYMHYGNYRQARVIYVARDTGHIRVIPISRNQRIGELARLKAADILERVERREPPECECGYCNSGLNVGQSNGKSNHS